MCSHLSERSGRHERLGLLFRVRGVRSPRDRYRWYFNLWQRQEWHRDRHRRRPRPSRRPRGRRPGWHSEVAAPGEQRPFMCPASSMPPCPQRGDPVLFPFRCILFFEKRKKRKLFWALSSVRENLLGLGASHLLSPRLSTSSAGPAPSRPAHRLHAGGTWACPLERPRGALHGPNPVLVPTCRAVAGGGGSP